MRDAHGRSVLTSVLIQKRDLALSEKHIFILFSE
jgi:hypothetical protein